MLCIEAPAGMEPNIDYRYPNINGPTARRASSNTRDTRKTSSATNYNTSNRQGYKVTIGKCKMQTR